MNTFYLLTCHMTYIRKCMCLPFYPDPSPTASSPWVSDPEQLYFVPRHSVHIQPLHDSQCMVLTRLTSTCNSHTGHQMWYKEKRKEKRKTLACKNMFHNLQDCRLWSSWVHTGFSLGADVAGPATFSWPDYCPVVLSAPPLNHSLPNCSARQGHQSNPPGPLTPVLPRASHMNHEACRRHIIWKSQYFLNMFPII